MPSQIQNPPNAYYLVDSLRSTGYSFDAAVADIVDNSISAGAKHIDLYIPPTGERPYLAFVDDGCGMDRDELIRAMRFASFSKDEERKDSDLGRFGLGLKLASSSQCRRFTVLSKKNGKLSGMVWDLDSLMKEQSWVMGELSESECQKLPKFDELDVNNNGTMVLWENFDVLRNANSGKEYGPLVDKVDSACNHLALVFHRFLNGSDADVTIKVNHRSLPYRDPFLANNKKTEPGKPETLSIRDDKGIERYISVQTYLLPFQKDLTDEDYEILGGKESLFSKQGFYVYRNKRLIIYGTWFRMSHSQELTKYGRIRVDVPSSLDSIWQVDVKKQQASLPLDIRKQLSRLVDKTQGKSKKKSLHRASIRSDSKFSLWSTSVTRDKKVSFVINREAPLLQKFEEKLDGAQRNYLNILLDSIETSIPYINLYTQVASNNIDSSLTQERKDEILENCLSLAATLKMPSGEQSEQFADLIINYLNYREYEDWLKPKLLGKMYGRL